MPVANAVHSPSPVVDAADFWVKAASDIQVAFDFLTPPSRRAVPESVVGSLADHFRDLCLVGYSEAEAFQSTCLLDASRRLTGGASVLDLAGFLREYPNFLLPHSLPGPPPGSPGSALSPRFPPTILEAGQKFARSIASRHRQPVHPLSRHVAFLLVVSFGRADFRLEVSSVELALEVALGARGALLQVVQLAERVFRFSVCSKHVGMDIIKLSSVSNSSFICFFHLWSLGGPNWRREHALWLAESEAEWSLVLHSKRCSANALQALAIGDSLGTQSILKKRSAARRSRPNRLRFADCIAYEACLGYGLPSASCAPLTSWFLVNFASSLIRPVFLLR